MNSIPFSFFSLVGNLPEAERPAAEAVVRLVEDNKVAVNSARFSPWTLFGKKTNGGHWICFIHVTVNVLRRQMQPEFNQGTVVRNSDIVP
jgi:hypothetical protein